MQTKTVKEIVHVLREVVIDMNTSLYNTQLIHNIIQEHDRAVMNQKRSHKNRVAHQEWRDNHG